MTSMTNWTQYGSPGGERVTTWAYHPQRGWLSSKTYADNDGPSYTHTPGGRLKTRLWERGLSTTYHYGFEVDSHSGDLTQVTYSDATPSVSITYDRLARAKVVTHSGITTTLVYTNYANQILSETYAGGILDGYAVIHSHDNLLRPSGADAWKTTLLAHQAFGYNPQNGLINSASDGTNVATYSYIANSPLIGQITFQHGGQTRMITTNHYDPLNRLVWITNQVGAVAVTSAYYTNNLANQRTGVRLLDGSYWVYQYDALGQVQWGNKHWADGGFVPGQQFEYTHDQIGNRTETQVGGDQNGTGLRLAAYAPNSLNQYESRTGTNLVDITGNANAASTVTVSVGGQAAASVYRHKEYFQAVAAVTNWASVAVTAVRGGTNTTQSGGLLVAPATQLFQYDADGNLTNDLVWTYTWDAENRLIAMECLVSGPTARHMTFEYDWQGRRIHKVVKDAQQSTLSDTRFLYEGWNLVAELNAQGGVGRSYLWGLDLSGTFQGAGGVGGLLAVTDATQGAHFVAYDGNGNVMALVKASDGSTTAQYEYGPFGEAIRVSGIVGKSNPFRWSTKYTDDETDLVYYGYRYYSASLGRWLSRDSITEAGGLNLYEFAVNSPQNAYDVLGEAVEWQHGFPKAIFTAKFFRSVGMSATELNIHAAEFGHMLDFAQHRGAIESIHSQKWNQKWLEWIAKQNEAGKPITANTLKRRYAQMKSLPEFRKFYQWGVPAKYDYYAWKAVEEKIRRQVNIKVGKLLAKRAKKLGSKAVPAIGIGASIYFFVDDCRAEG